MRWLLLQLHKFDILCWILWMKGVSGLLFPKVNSALASTIPLLSLPQ